MEKCKNVLMCSLLASTMLSGVASATEERFTADIQVVDVVSASAMRQLKFDVNVPVYRSISITSSNVDDLGLDIKNIQEGLYKIDGTTRHTINLSAEDIGNVSGVKVKGIDANVGAGGKNQDLIGNSISNLIIPGNKEDLRIKVASLDVNKLGDLNPASGSYFPEFNLDVSYE